MHSCTGRTPRCPAARPATQLQAAIHGPDSCKLHRPTRRICVEAKAGIELGRRSLLANGAAAAALALLVRPAAAEPFLISSGGKGILAEEEERLYRLRQGLEGEARARLLQEKEKLEEESRQTMAGKLCATPFGVDIVGITELVALIGALVGGITARQRKDELERLNEQLRRINLSLRQQARAGTVYAPGLTYAPPMAEDGRAATASPLPPPRAFLKPSGSNPHLPGAPRPGPGRDSPSSPAPSSTGSSVVAGAAAAATAVAAPLAPSRSPLLAGFPTTSLLSMEDEEMGTDQIQCRDALRAGKRLLKERNGAAALVRFEKALMLSKALADRVQERRAMRGLAAAARLQGQHRSAIKHLERVLEISKAMQEFTGDADAYGTIADCYTDMGELEKAAHYYDKYIDTMSRDGPV
ncbi:FLU chloroplast precursor, alternative spliced version s-FLP [Haematococcus lacustris]